jgi:cytochrome P450
MEEEKLSIVDLLDDPDAALERARARGTIVPIEMGYLVVDHEAARDLLLDRRLRAGFADFLQQMGVTSGAFFEWMSRSPLNMDGDEHRRWRRVMARTFTPHSVEKLRPFLRQEAIALVEAFADDGECEFMSAFARRLPSLGLCELIGVPKDDRERFGVWADTIGLGFNLALLVPRIADIDAALVALLDYCRGLVAARRENLRDDLVTRIARAASEEGGMDEDMVVASVAGLVFAGHETTKNQLGWLVTLLAERPEEWDRVAADPERSRAVVEEVLRLRGAVTSVGRTAAEDFSHAGAHLKQGDRVIVSLWGVNQDPKVFPQPTRFDVDAHREMPQMAFGHGMHHCLGAALARAELCESLAVLASRLRCPRIGEGAEFLPPIGINGPTRLPIHFERRR